jgi:predicted HTH domain antitoxin
MPQTARLEIPQDLLDTARLSLEEVKRELAVTLYAQGRLSIGKAHEFVGVSLWEFRQILAVRHLPPRYQEAELAEDLEALATLPPSPPTGGAPDAFCRR